MTRKLCFFLDAWIGRKSLITCPVGEPHWESVNLVNGFGKHQFKDWLPFFIP
jgi:hypothetical protein